MSATKSKMATPMLTQSGEKMHDCLECKKSFGHVIGICDEANTSFEVEINLAKYL